MKEAVKQVARALATLIVLPALVSFALRRALLGADRALMGSSQALSLVPGIVGQYLRTAFLRFAVAHCDASVVVEFGTIFSAAGVRLGKNVYIGPMCHIGLANIEDDVLIGAAVHIPSGPDTHGIADLDRPIREQPGRPQMVTVGEGAWIGSAAIVLQNVGAGAVIAAGAVVTRPVLPLVIAGGIPAKTLQTRGRAAE